MTLRIGVNALYLIPGGVGGTEVYLRNVLAQWALQPRGHEYVVFTNREADRELVPDHPAFRLVNTGVNATFRPARILYEQTLFVSDCRRERIDVLYNPGFTAPVLQGAPNVALIHDLQHHHHPEYFKPSDLLAWRFLVWASVRQSRRLLTVSEASREDIHNVYGVPLEQIDTVEPGVEPEFFRIERGETEPLILCVSTLHPHKNIDRLVDAYAEFRKRRPEYRLVLAGMRGFHGDAVERRVRALGLQEHVRMTGWVSREEVRALYGRARFAVFPSTFEGFGIPVVEAMAAGVPLITSAIRPMTDTAGDTALLFPPDDTQALVDAMERLASDGALAVDLAQRARKRAAAYTWARTAASTLDSLERAVRR